MNLDNFSGISYSVKLWILDPRSLLSNFFLKILTCSWILKRAELNWVFKTPFTYFLIRPNKRSWSSWPRTDKTSRKTISRFCLITYCSIMESYFKLLTSMLFKCMYIFIMITLTFSYWFIIYRPVIGIYIVLCSVLYVSYFRMIGLFWTWLHRIIIDGKTLLCYPSHQFPWCYLYFRSPDSWCHKKYLTIIFYIFYIFNFYSKSWTIFYFRFPHSTSWTKSRPVS